MKLITFASTGLIEYNGDFYTAEELSEKLEASGDFSIILNEEHESWFGEALSDTPAVPKLRTKESFALFLADWKASREQ